MTIFHVFDECSVFFSYEKDSEKARILSRNILKKLINYIVCQANMSRVVSHVLLCIASVNETHRFITYYDEVSQIIATTHMGSYQDRDILPVFQ